MSKTLEQLANEIFKEMKSEGEEVTREEALKMAEMEIKAKGIKNYVKDVQKEKKKTRTPKVDPIKVQLIQEVTQLLDDTTIKLEEITIKNPQKEIGFKIGEDNYTFSLIKHRQKK